MAGEASPPKKARTRSPAYPYLALPEALDRTAQLRRAEGRHAVSVSVAMQHWGYKAESSTGYSCIAALKKFGLVDEEGVGEHREVRLSALALAILLDGDNGSLERAAALRTAALNPRIHAELWERYGPELPSDQTLRRFLLLEKNFNEASVDEFVAEYRATIAYAGLSEPAGDAGAVSSILPKPATPTAAAPARPAVPPPRKSEPPTLPGLDPESELRPPAVGSPLPRREPPRQGPAPAASRPRGEEEPAGDALRPVTPTPAVPPPEHLSAPAAGPGMATPPPEGNRELPVPLDRDLVARIPYPMSEESYALLLDTLQLWKKRLVRPVG